MKHLALTLLVLTVLAAACGPAALPSPPPASPTEEAGGGFPPEVRTPSSTEAPTEAPVATQGVADPLLHWENRDDCKVLESDGQNLSYGSCNGELTTVPASELDLLRLEEWSSLYAPFDVSLLGSSAMDIVLDGQGSLQSADVEQRAIGEWASLRYDELESGRSGAAWGLVLDWNRQGGIAGFCDEVTVFLTGDYYVSNCKSASSTPGATVEAVLPPQLTTTQLEQLYNWYDTFKSFEYEYTDPAVSDAMTIKFTFAGQGEQDATQEDIQAINDFASGLVVQSAQEPSPPAAVAAQEALADQLGIPATEVTIASAVPEEWPDSCLGVQKPGIMCAQVITPGYLVMLEANGQQYEYHTDLTGDIVVAAP